MIIQQLTGGLGNQMFQYAAARSLSLKHNTELFLDTTHFLTTPGGKKNIRKYELQHFDIQQKFIKPRFHWLKKYFKSRVVYPGFTHFREKHVEFHPEFLSLPDNTYLEGVFQSEKYFENCRTAIIRELTFTTEAAPENQDRLDEIRNLESVSLHVRRGDYVSNPHTNQVHGTTTLEYYGRAIEHIMQNTSRPVFYLFSDEPKWLVENMKIDAPCKIISGNSGDTSFEDMRLMSNCKHNIIANSSFSWWGAWLNSNPAKVVVAPQQWFARNEYNTSDIIPESWIKV